MNWFRHMNKMQKTNKKLFNKNLTNNSNLFWTEFKEGKKKD